MAILFDPFYQASDANGLPLSGATLAFYQADTTTPITIYQDAAEATPHAGGEVVADASGLFPPVYVDPTITFKTVLKDEDGATIQTVPVINLAAEGVLIADENLADLPNPVEALDNLGGTPNSRTISAGTGLTGGGSLAANRTLAVDFASSGDLVTGTSTSKVIAVADVVSMINSRGKGWDLLRSTSAAGLTSIDCTAVNATISNYQRVIIRMKECSLSATGAVELYLGSTGAGFSFGSDLVSGSISNADTFNLLIEIDGVNQTDWQKRIEASYRISGTSTAHPINFTGYDNLVDQIRVSNNGGSSYDAGVIDFFGVR